MHFCMGFVWISYTVWYEFSEGSTVIIVATAIQSVLFCSHCRARSYNDCGIVKASKRTGGVPELHCKPSKHKKESTEDKICLEIIPQNYLNSDIFFGVEKKSE